MTRQEQSQEKSREAQEKYREEKLELERAGVRSEQVRGKDSTFAERMQVAEMIRKDDASLSWDQALKLAAELRRMDDES